MTRFDKETLDWFKDHREEQTTLCKCEACGLFYGYLTFSVVLRKPTT